MPAETFEKITPLEPLCLRPKDAAKLIGVSERTFATMRACGQLPPSYKLNGCVVYRTADLRKWVEFGFPNLDKYLKLIQNQRS